MPFFLPPKSVWQERHARRISQAFLRILLNKSSGFYEKIPQPIKNVWESEFKAVPAVSTAAWTRNLEKSLPNRLSHWITAKRLPRAKFCNSRLFLIQLKFRTLSASPWHRTAC
jgi:hypothetical protein